MVTYYIHRVSLIEEGTFGVFMDDRGAPFALTLEPPWKENKRNESCIPFGDYKCQRIISPSHGEVFEIMNVPERTHILIHKGNTVDDTLGCIVVGEEFGYLNGEIAVLHSGRGFNELMRKLKGIDTFTLNII